MIKSITYSLFKVDKRWNPVTQENDKTLFKAGIKSIEDAKRMAEELGLGFGVGSQCLIEQVFDECSPYGDWRDAHG